MEQSTKMILKARQARLERETYKLGNEIQTLRDRYSKNQYELYLIHKELESIENPEVTGWYGELH